MKIGKLAAIFVSVIGVGIIQALSQCTYCNSDHYTVGPTTQPATPTACVQITISPSYQAPCVDNYCTELNYTDSGPNIVTITQSTLQLVYVSRSIMVNAYCGYYSGYSPTTSTFTVSQPVNFSSCTCPG